MFEIGHSVEEKMKSVAFFAAISMELYFLPEISAQVSPGARVGLLSSAAMAGDTPPEVITKADKAKIVETGLFNVNSPGKRQPAAKSRSVSFSQVDGISSSAVSVSRSFP